MRIYPSHTELEDFYYHYIDGYTNERIGSTDVERMIGYIKELVDKYIDLNVEMSSNYQTKSNDST